MFADIEGIPCQGIAGTSGKIFTNFLPPGSYKIAPSYHLCKCTAAASAQGFSLARSALCAFEHVLWLLALGVRKTSSKAIG